MIHIDLCHSIPTLSQRYKLRVVPYEDDYDKIMEVYQSLGTKFDERCWIWSIAWS